MEPDPSTAFSSGFSFAAPSPPSPLPTSSYAFPSSTADADADADNTHTCRICLDPVPPPYPDLISPCLCTGTSRYVHRACLTTWRLTSRTAYYQCPTCHYRYRLSRLTYSRILASSSLRIALSLLILLALIWALGYMSEPLLARNLGIDLDLDELESLQGTYLAHLLRGTASLGCMGFLKVVYFLGPGAAWNLRQMGGRERGVRLGWLMVAVGVLNFFWWLWKAVGGFVENRLGKAAGDVEEVGEREDVRGFWEEVGYRAVRAWVSIKSVWEQRGPTGEAPAAAAAAL